MNALGWLTDRQRDGGVDRIPLPDVAGQLWLCGKHAVVTRYESGEWDHVVCLTERHELAGHYADYVAWLDRGDSSTWFPIHDLHAPSRDAMAVLVTTVVERLAGGERVLMHCAAGMGRAGTTAACVLIALGHDAEAALQIVADARPGAGPEAGVQRDLVESFAERKHHDLH